MMTRQEAEAIYNAGKDRSLGKVGSRPSQESRTFENAEWRHVVRQVDQAEIGLNRQHHSLADGYGIVHMAKICHENNRWVGWLGRLCLCGEYCQGHRQEGCKFHNA